MGQNVLNN